jgi:hypothetical protein
MALVGKFVLCKDQRYPTNLLATIFTLQNKRLDVSDYCGNF